MQLHRQTLQGLVHRWTLLQVLVFGPGMWALELYRCLQMCGKQPISTQRRPLPPMQQFHHSIRCRTAYSHMDETSCTVLP